MMFKQESLDFMNKFSQTAINDKIVLNAIENTFENVAKNMITGTSTYIGLENTIKLYNKFKPFVKIISPVLDDKISIEIKKLRLKRNKLLRYLSNNEFIRELHNSIREGKEKLRNIKDEIEQQTLEYSPRKFLEVIDPVIMPAVNKAIDIVAPKIKEWTFIFKFFTKEITKFTFSYLKEKITRERKRRLTEKDILVKILKPVYRISILFKQLNNFKNASKLEKLITTVTVLSSLKNLNLNKLTRESGEGLIRFVNSKIEQLRYILKTSSVTRIKETLVQRKKERKDFWWIFKDLAKLPIFTVLGSLPFLFKPILFKLGGLVKKVFTLFKTVLSKLIDWSRKLFKEFWKKLRDGVSLLKKGFGWLLLKFKGLKKLAAKLKEKLKSTFKKLKEITKNLKEKFQKVIQRFKDKVNNLKNRIIKLKEKLGNTIKTLKEKINSLKEKVSSLSSKVKNLVKEKLEIGKRTLLNLKDKILSKISFKRVTGISTKSLFKNASKRYIIGRVLQAGSNLVAPIPYIGTPLKLTLTALGTYLTVDSIAEIATGEDLTTRIKDFFFGKHYEKEDFKQKVFTTRQTPNFGQQGYTPATTLETTGDAPTDTYILAPVSVEYKKTY